MDNKKADDAKRIQYKEGYAPIKPEYVYLYLILSNITIVLQIMNVLVHLIILVIHNYILLLKSIFKYKTNIQVCESRSRKKII